MILQDKLHSCAELMEYINEIGFLPLLPLGIRGWSAEEVVDEDCQYVQLPEGGFEWPLWGLEGRHHQGDRLCLRQVYLQEGCVHQ